LQSNAAQLRVFEHACPQGLALDLGFSVRIDERIGDFNLLKVMVATDTTDNTLDFFFSHYRLCHS
jgi:hypothetical protein